MSQCALWRNLCLTRAPESVMHRHATTIVSRHRETAREQGNMRWTLGQKPWIIAHRGANGLVPFGNTMEAFEEAVRLGAPMVELDVRRTRDGELVCFHDEGVDGALLADLTYVELCDRTKALGFVAPRLEDVLRRFRQRVQFDIELKEAGYEDTIIAMVTSYVGRAEFICKSFLDEAVAGLKARDHTVRAGLLLGMDGPRFSMRLRLPELWPEMRLGRCQADFVSPHYGLVRLGLLSRMHSIGMAVYVWTVNDEPTMMSLLEQGADAIITDRPDVGLSVLERFWSRAS